MKKNFLALFLYLLLALVFLRGIIFKPGIIIGSDWSLPSTVSQARVFAERNFFTWSDNLNLFGTRFFNSGGFFDLVIFLLVKLGLSGPLLSKLLLLTLFTLIGFSGFWFCQKIGLTSEASLLAGLIYLTTPLVFNYSIMGWFFILLTLILIPFFLLIFELSIKTGAIKYSVIAGLLFALAFLQSQSLFWFPLLMVISGIFIINSKKTFLLFLRSLLIILVICFLLHCWWLLPLIFSPDQGVVKTVSLYDITRFESKLNFSNIIKMWGGLYNFQFELSYPQILLPISFILPVFSYLALLWLGKNKKVLQLVTISLAPLIIYSLRNTLYRIPFSVIIRDFGRMMILSALPYSVLTVITFEEFKKIKNKSINLFLRFLIIGLVVLNSLPFWTGKLFAKTKEDWIDQRLRTLDFSSDYQKQEAFFANDKSDSKVLYLPAGLLLGFLDNKDFYGPYKEAVDIFAILSQKPGALALSDKNTGPSVDYGKLIIAAVENNDQKKLEKLLALTSVKEVVVRKNAYNNLIYGDAVEGLMEKILSFTKVFNSNKISIFQKSNFLSHFYVPQQKILVGDNPENMDDFLELANVGPNPAFLSGYGNKEIPNDWLNNTEKIFLKAQIQDANLSLRNQIKKDKTPNNFLAGEIEYTLDIPKDGNYEFYFNDELEEGRLKNWEVNGNLIPISKTGLPQNGWLPFGSLMLKKGNVKIKINLNKANNLLGNAWKVFNLEKNTDQNLTFKTKGISQTIENWKRGNYYLFSFDYQGAETDFGLIFTEKKKGEFKPILEKEFFKDKSNNHFQVVLEAQENEARIYFYGLKKEISLGGITFNNLELVKLTEPEIILKNSQNITPGSSFPIPKLTSTKINPTKYRLLVENAQNPYSLVFAESFHPDWQVSVGGKILPEKRHYLVNGYANLWFIEPQDANEKSNYELVVQFCPQRFFYLGLLISAASFLGLIGYLLTIKLKKRYVSN